MRCKTCGSELVLTRKPFIMNSYIPILDVECRECPNCHERTFDQKGSEDLAMSMDEYRRKRVLRLLERPVPRFRESSFAMPDSEDAVEGLFVWAQKGPRVARLGEPREGLACMSAGTYRMLADASFPASPIFLWELEDFCVEDMPTLQHVFRALDTDAFIELLVSERRKASANDGGDAARRELMGKLAYLRGLETVSCDENPVVLLPRRVYGEREQDGTILENIEVSGYRFSFDADDMAGARLSLSGVTLEVLLGWKAWLALPGTRETYELLAELFAKLLGSEDDGGEPPTRRESPSVQRLNDAANDDFRSYLFNLLGKMIPADDLVSISFTIDADLLEKVEVIMEAQGLTMQNALNIAVHRIVNGTFRPVDQTSL